MELIRKNKFTNLSQLGTRPEFVKFILPFSGAFPGTVHTFPALYTTRTLLFKTNSVFFPRFSSFERFSSITVVFSRAFHLLNASPPYQLRSLHFSSFANFPAFCIIYTSPVLWYKLRSSSPFPLPHLFAGASFRFFSSFVLCTLYTSDSLRFSCALCHSRLLHPSLYLKYHKTAEFKLRYLAFLA